MENRLSVIIPVYNSIKYLNRCIQSLIDQTYKDIQIILVDDGSTDGSSELCDDFSKKNESIKVVHTENKGVGHARNIGINESDGELIAFLDSDDYISNNFYECLISKLPSFSFGTIVIDDGATLKPIRETNLPLFIKNPSDLTYFVVGDFEEENSKIINKSRIFGSVCRSIFIKEFIVKNSLLFDENLQIGEDLVFLLNYLKYVTKTEISDCQYFYVKNTNSATNSLCEGYTLHFLDRFKRLTDSVIKSIRNSNMDECKKNKLIEYQKMKFCLSFSINELLLCNNKNKIKMFFKNQTNRIYLSFSIKSIKTLEQISFRRAVLLTLIKKRAWGLIGFLLRRKTHA